MVIHHCTHRGGCESCHKMLTQKSVKKCIGESNPNPNKKYLSLARAVMCVSS